MSLVSRAARLGGKKKPAGTKRRAQDSPRTRRRHPRASAQSSLTGRSLDTMQGYYPSADSSLASKNRQSSDSLGLASYCPHQDRRSGDYPGADGLLSRQEAEGLQIQQGRRSRGSAHEVKERLFLPECPGPAKTGSAVVSPLNELFPRRGPEGKLRAVRPLGTFVLPKKIVGLRTPWD